MKKQSLKISVIIPCYNQSEFLEETLKSVINQKYKNWECILINDGSTDKTIEIINKWEGKEPRIKSYSKKNGGLSSARNYGLKYTTGDFIQFLDSDDVLDENKLSKSIQEFKKNKDAKIVITNYFHFQSLISKATPAYYNLKIEYFNFERILFQWENTFTIPIHCALFSASLFKTFKFPEELKAKEDWFMWILMFSKYPVVIFIDKPLAYYRIHNNSMTNSNADKIKENLIVFYNIIKAEISEPNYVQLIENSNKKYIQKYFLEKNKLNNIKHSNAYKIGRKIDKIIKKIDLLNLRQYIIKKKQ